MEYHLGAWGLPCPKAAPQPPPPPKPISLHVLLVMRDEFNRNNLQELLHRVNYQVFFERILRIIENICF